MNFEFNQSEVNCAVGPNKERTPGDLLIEYAIDQGGARANITVCYWDGSAWGTAMDLDAPSPLCGGEPCAADTINSSPIPATESDGLIDSGLKQARTFGEAQIDLRLIFQSDKCVSFGSATLKSRSSDSFTSQLKDFVAPVGINLQNCGPVIIRKETNPEENPNVTSFDFTKAFATDPATSDTFSLTDDGSQSFDNVLFGSGYTVTEDNIPAGWILENLDCSASTGVSANINGATVTFDIDSADDTLDFTYTNKKQVGAILVTKTYKHAASGSGDHPQAGVSFTVNGVTKATDVNGQACFDGLLFGNYTVTETVPSGYVADNPPGASQDVIVSVTSDCGDGNEAQVSFRNTPLTDLTVSVNSQVDGGTASTFTCVDENGLTIGTGSTGANGDGSLTVNDLLPGTYTCTMVIDP